MLILDVNTDVNIGKVWATVTEDMDALTFGTPILLRNLTYAESRKMDIYEIHYDKILPLLELTQRQFVDLCILCGCDYASSIKGIGPKSALKLIKEHKTLEGEFICLFILIYLLEYSIWEIILTIPSGILFVL